MRWIIDRKYPKSDYIIGTLKVDSQFFCNTLERPWKNNANNISCIPAGCYEVLLTYSAKFKRNLPLVTGVPKRTGIRFHRGNKVSDSSGCILVGENKVKGMVLNSTTYEEKLVQLLKVAQSKGEKTFLIISQ